MLGLLDGVRVWLAGAIPDDSTPEERDRLTEFVRKLAQAVFREGGTLIHGSHPSVRDGLFEVARTYQKQTRETARLIMAVSALFTPEPEKYGIDLKEWREICLEVQETPVTSGPDGEPNHLGRSLSLMRDWMAGQSDVVIVVGGRNWEIALHRAGVVEELELATSRGLPAFLIPVFGGAAHGFFESHPEMLRQCRNGLSESQNIELSRTGNATDLAMKIVAQISRLPLRRRELEFGKAFRILCLDGGGIKGTFTAAVLAHWENTTGMSIVDHFDLIAGTSTGGILAIGLGLGLKAQSMLDFYMTEGPEIFPTDKLSSRLRHAFLHWLDSKFDQSVLETKLKLAYGKAPQGQSLKKSLCRLLVPSFDTYADKPYLFRTPHARLQFAQAEDDPVQVALATAAAPTYFKPITAKSSEGSIRAIDGGVWSNHPGLAALSEAVGELSVPLDRIDMLSIGTTYSIAKEGTPHLGEGAAGWLFQRVRGWFGDKQETGEAPEGKIWWAANIAALLLKTQGQSIDQGCAALLGERYLRVDVPSNAEDLGDVTAIQELRNLGSDVASQRRFLDPVRSRFLNRIPADRWK